MAQDFDEDAAVPVNEAIEQLRAELGASTTPANGEDKGHKAETQGADPAPLSRDVQTGDDANNTSSDDHQDSDEQATKGDADDDTPDPLAGYSPGIRKIIEGKYGGDIEAFERGIFEQQNSLSTMSKQLKAIEDKLSSLSEEEEPEYNIAEDPNIKSIEEDIASFQSEIADNIKDMNQLVAAGEKINAEIARLEGRAEAEQDPTEKRDIQRTIDAKRDKISTLASQWKSLDRENRNTQRQVQSATRQRSYVESKIKENIARQTNSAKENQTWLRGQGQLFDAAVKVLGEAKKLDAEDLVYLRTLLVGDFQVNVNNLKDPFNSPPIDVVKFVKERGQFHLARMARAETRKFAGQSKAKVEATPTIQAPAARGTPAPRTSTGGPAPSRSRGQVDVAEAAQQARAHAAKVLGG